MKHSIQLCVALLCVLSVLLVGLCACSGERPHSTVTLDPIDDGGLAGRPTVAVPYGQMTFNYLMGMNAASIKWSHLSQFTHSVTSGTTAVFPVADEYGEEMEMQVEFDIERDVVLKADVHYESLVISILTDDDSVLVPLLEALRDHHNQTAE